MTRSGLRRIVETAHLLMAASPSAKGLGLDHDQVHIGVLVVVPTGSGTEQDHLLRIHFLQDEANHPLHQVVRDLAHGGIRKARRALRRRARGAQGRVEARRMNPPTSSLHCGRRGCSTYIMCPAAKSARSMFARSSGGSPACSMDQTAAK